MISLCCCAGVESLDLSNVIGELGEVVLAESGQSIHKLIDVNIDDGCTGFFPLLVVLFLFGDSEGVLVILSCLDRLFYPTLNILGESIELGLVEEESRESLGRYSL